MEFTTFYCLNHDITYIPAVVGHNEQQGPHLGKVFIHAFLGGVKFFVFKHNESGIIGVATKAFQKRVESFLAIDPTCFHHDEEGDLCVGDIKLYP